MEAQEVTSVIAQGVAEITLNRPDKLNSFNEAMHRALRTALAAARDDVSCRAVVLTGAGRAFCAGQDLGDRDPRKMQGPPDLGDTLTRLFNPLIEEIRSLDKPVICAVNGVAAGAGANLALACDIVLAADSARFIQSFANVGLIPDSGGSWLLPRLIGEARAKAIAMTALPVSAQQAQSWGMIWQVVPDEDLLAEARRLARELAQGATFGLGLTKQAIQAAATNTLAQQPELEATAQARAGRSPDYGEGVAAFLEKRAAKFTGREHASGIEDQST
jgi:2-(1,2-epoxy-1,2-dihydrophenyl)acetyl-CoA isomerase